MSKHSPAPWDYDPESDFHNDPRSGIAYVDISAGAEVDTNSRFARIDKGATTKADAQLIAAAPDLLAVMKDAVDVLTPYERGTGYETSLQPLCRRILAAIAKAESQ